MAIKREVHGRRKKGRLDKVRGDIKEKGLSGMKYTTELHGSVYRQTSTHIKVEYTIKE